MMAVISPSPIIAAIKGARVLSERFRWLSPQQARIAPPTMRANVERLWLATNSSTPGCTMNQKIIRIAYARLELIHPIDSGQLLT